MTTTFIDRTGRRWDIALTDERVGAVREYSGIDLRHFSPADGERLANDPALLVDTLWILCESQAKRRRISDVLFGRSLPGEAIVRAVHALLAATEG